MLTSPGHPQPDCTPDVDPHKAHRPTRDTRHAYRATRDKHTRRTHNVLKLAYQALMCLRHCLMSHKPRGLWCLHARYFCQQWCGPPWPLAHGMSMRTYRLTQSSREASMETALALARAAYVVSHSSWVILAMTDMPC